MQKRVLLLICLFLALQTLALSHAPKAVAQDPSSNNEAASTSGVLTVDPVGKPETKIFFSSVAAPELDDNDAEQIQKENEDLKVTQEIVGENFQTVVVREEGSNDQLPQALTQGLKPVSYINVPKDLAAKIKSAPGRALRAGKWSKGIVLGMMGASFTGLAVFFTLPADQMLQPILFTFATTALTASYTDQIESILGAKVAPGESATLFQKIWSVTKIFAWDVVLSNFYNLYGYNKSNTVAQTSIDAVVGGVFGNTHSFARNRMLSGPREIHGKLVPRGNLTLTATMKLMINPIFWGVQAWNRVGKLPALFRLEMFDYHFDVRASNLTNWFLYTALVFTYVAAGNKIVPKLERLDQKITAIENRIGRRFKDSLQTFAASSVVIFDGKAFDPCNVILLGGLAEPDAPPRDASLPIR